MDWEKKKKEILQYLKEKKGQWVSIKDIQKYSHFPGETDFGDNPMHDILQELEGDEKVERINRPFYRFKSD